MDIAVSVPAEYSCSNCFILAKKLNNTKEWNKFYQQKLENRDKLLRIAQDYQRAKQHNVELQLAFDQRSRELTFFREQMTNLMLKLEPLKKQLEEAEQKKQDEEQRRERSEDMMMGLNFTIVQLKHQIKQLREIADHNMVETLEKKLNNSRLEVKRLKNIIEDKTCDIDELRKFQEDRRLYYTRLNKKAFWALKLAKHFAEAMPKDAVDNALYEKVLTSYAALNDVVKVHYEQFRQEEIRKNKKIGVELTTYPSMEEWLNDFDICPQDEDAKIESPVNSLNKKLPSDEGRKLEMLLQEDSCNADKQQGVPKVTIKVEENFCTSNKKCVDELENKPFLQRERGKDEKRIHKQHLLFDSKSEEDVNTSLLSCTEKRKLPLKESLPIESKTRRNGVNKTDECKSSLKPLEKDSESTIISLQAFSNAESLSTIRVIEKQELTDENKDGTDIIAQIMEEFRPRSKLDCLDSSFNDIDLEEVPSLSEDFEEGVLLDCDISSCENENSHKEAYPVFGEQGQVRHLFKEDICTSVEVPKILMSQSSEGFPTVGIDEDLNISFSESFVSALSPVYGKSDFGGDTDENDKLSILSNADHIADVVSSPTANRKESSPCNKVNISMPEDKKITLVNMKKQKGFLLESSENRSPNKAIPIDQTENSDIINQGNEEIIKNSEIYAPHSESDLLKKDDDKFMTGSSISNVNKDHEHPQSICNGDGKASMNSYDSSHMSSFTSADCLNFKISDKHFIETSDNDLGECIKGKALAVNSDISGPGDPSLATGSSGVESFNEKAVESLVIKGDENCCNDLEDIFGPISDSEDENPKKFLKEMKVNIFNEKSWSSSHQKSIYNNSSAEKEDFLMKNVKPLNEDRSQSILERTCSSKCTEQSLNVSDNLKSSSLSNVMQSVDKINMIKLETVLDNESDLANSLQRTRVTTGDSKGCQVLVSSLSLSGSLESNDTQNSDVECNKEGAVKIFNREFGMKIESVSDENCSLKHNTDEISHKSLNTVSIKRKLLSSNGKNDFLNPESPDKYVEEIGTIMSTSNYSCLSRSQKAVVEEKCKAANDEGLKVHTSRLSYEDDNKYIKAGNSFQDGQIEVGDLVITRMEASDQFMNCELQKSRLTDSPCSSTNTSFSSEDHCIGLEMQNFSKVLNNHRCKVFSELNQDLPKSLWKDNEHLNVRNSNRLRNRFQKNDVIKKFQDSTNFSCAGDELVGLQKRKSVSKKSPIAVEGGKSSLSSKEHVIQAKENTGPNLEKMPLMTRSKSKQNLLGRSKGDDSVIEKIKLKDKVLVAKRKHSTLFGDESVFVEDPQRVFHKRRKLRKKFNSKQSPKNIDSESSDEETSERKLVALETLPATSVESLESYSGTKQVNDKEITWHDDQLESFSDSEAFSFMQRVGKRVDRRNIMTTIGSHSSDSAEENTEDVVEAKQNEICKAKGKIILQEKQIREYELRRRKSLKQDQKLKIGSKDENVLQEKQKLEPGLGKKTFQRKEADREFIKKNMFKREKKAEIECRDISSEKQVVGRNTRSAKKLQEANESKSLNIQISEQVHSKMEDINLKTTKENIFERELPENHMETSSKQNVMKELTVEKFLESKSQSDLNDQKYSSKDSKIEKTDLHKRKTRRKNFKTLLVKKAARVSKKSYVPLSARPQYQHLKAPDIGSKESLPPESKSMSCSPVKNDEMDFASLNQVKSVSEIAVRLNANYRQMHIKERKTILLEKKHSCTSTQKRMEKFCENLHDGDTSAMPRKFITFSESQFGTLPNFSESNDKESKAFVSKLLPTGTESKKIIVEKEYSSSDDDAMLIFENNSDENSDFEVNSLTCVKESFETNRKETSVIGVPHPGVVSSLAQLTSLTVPKLQSKSTSGPLKESTSDTVKEVVPASSSFVNKLFKQKSAQTTNGNHSHHENSGSSSSKAPDMSDRKHIQNGNTKENAVSIPNNKSETSLSNVELSNENNFIPNFYRNLATDGTHSSPNLVDEQKDKHSKEEYFLEQCNFPPGNTSPVLNISNCNPPIVEDSTSVPHEYLSFQNQVLTGDARKDQEEYLTEIVETIRQTDMKSYNWRQIINSLCFKKSSLCHFSCMSRVFIKVIASTDPLEPMNPLLHENALTPSLFKIFQAMCIFEQRMEIPPGHFRNMLMMGTHKLIVRCHPISPNSLGSLSAWYTASCTLPGDWQYERLRCFIIDLLMHHPGSAHQALLSCVSTSKRAFIRASKYRKITCLERVIQWVVWHGRWVGAESVRTRLVEWMCKNLDVNGTPPREPIVLASILLKEFTFSKDDGNARNIIVSIILLARWQNAAWISKTLIPSVLKLPINKPPTKKAKDTMHSKQMTGNLKILVDKLHALTSVRKGTGWVKEARRP
ncbi:hypothetical protein SK128_022951 [Halocaridina rubra]|uniref:Uncharacterized protein n=1 Tax=Halocaridina rubra TaxID=373956 RepID=A0AAN8XQY4_HALRR